MFENEWQTRCAICGTGILLAAVFLFARLPFVLLLVPVAVLFIGLTAEPYHTHAIWYGMMNVLGIFRIDRLIPEDLEIYTQQPHYFWLGEVGMSAMLAGVFAVPVGIYLTGRTGIALAFILAMIVFMPLFVFLPKLIQRGMQADAEAVVEVFGKNEQVMKVIWALAIAIAGLVITKVLDPGAAQQVVGVITGL
jgi:hypothetical protein